MYELFFYLCKALRAGLINYYLFLHYHLRPADLGPCEQI